MIYDWHPFKDSHWLMKNIIGNWQVAPIYTFQSGTWATVQSGVDSNLNGDTAGDRAFVNPSGNPNIGSGATALTNTAGQTVAYLATNPNAGYVVAPQGTLPTGGRNTVQLRPIDNVDMTFAKIISLGKEGRYSVRFDARFLNILNHPQYVGGFLNDIAPAGAAGSSQVNSQAIHNYLIPNTTTFLDPTQSNSSNPRGITLAVKVSF